jgi:hypothetical protein
MIRVERAIHKRSINNSRAVPLAQLLRHLQPLSLPDQAKTLTAQRNVFCTKPREDLATAKARIPLRKIMNPTNQLRFFDTA